MKIDKEILKQLSERLDEGDNILRTGIQPLPIPGFDFSREGRKLGRGLSYRWGTSCLELLSRVFGKESDYYRTFNRFSSEFEKYDSFSKALGVIAAAKNDYKKGYLFNTRTLIEAEVFDDFLEQAEELVKKGYHQPAAVIAGCVLEDGLRKLCDRNSITLQAKTTIDPMNVELAKAGIYTKLTQKKITALADLRNKAAHGEWDQFTEKDVEDMIRDVRRFMEEYFS